MNYSKFTHEEVIDALKTIPSEALEKFVNTEQLDGDIIQHLLDNTKEYQLRLNAIRLSRDFNKLLEQLCEKSNVNKNSTSSAVSDTSTS